MSETSREVIYFWIFRLSAFLGISTLMLVIWLLFQSGYSVINWTFLSAGWQHRNIASGGIFPAIVGSLYVGLGVICISFPLGLSTAIFLTEFNKNPTVKKILKLVIRNLAGVPSVVYGLFGFAVFVNLLSFGTSLLSAILTLSLMTLPWIIVTSIEALESVPQKFRDSSLALGATQWQTVQKVVLPTSIAGSITGGILSVARAMGETAPIIIVGATFYLSQLPSSVFDKFMALPYHVFILATQHSSPLAPAYASGTALVLMSLIFFLSLMGISLRYYYRKKRDW